jgi:hypothetical protein
VLSLKKGRLRCEVVHAAGAFRISTPLGDVVDRGTVFTVEVQPSEQEEAMTKNQKRGAGAAVVAVGVILGWVEFRQGGTEAAAPVPVKAGQTLVARAGQEPIVTSAAAEVPAPAPAGVLGMKASVDEGRALVTVTWDAPEYAPETLLDVLVFRVSGQLRPLPLESKKAAAKKRLLKIQLSRDALEVPGRYVARVSYDPVRQFPDTPRHPAASAEAAFFERADPEDAAARRLREIDVKLAAGQQGKTGQEGKDDEMTRRVEATATGCMNNLKQIGLAMMLFESREGKYPDTLDAVVRSGDLPEPLACPCHEGGKYVYLTLPASPNLILEPSGWIIAHENAPNALGKRTALFLDGHCELMDEKAFQERLAAQRALAK